ncbi:ATP-binding cassette transporter snq2 [Tilletia horrida]|uniref:ATP-binding cassette transporter snq2 n=1 Tax=Tilletia horrida TaxID=155126 RepID=A0AAN6JUU8_9BASI|nr:ATP-binding cassette transporter snq2 [Tilletia horrida]KAK0558963.1 ATP-binding cassette transporter snq2 [Tilletia horrida]
MTQRARCSHYDVALTPGSYDLGPAEDLQRHCGSRAAEMVAGIAGQLILHLIQNTADELLDDDSAQGRRAPAYSSGSARLVPELAMRTTEIRTTLRAEAKKRCEELGDGRIRRVPPGRARRQAPRRLEEVAIHHPARRASVRTSSSARYSSLPETAAGGFLRGGVLFIGLLFNALVAFSESPTQMGNRSILYKQQGYHFYRPSAPSLAQLTADIPFTGAYFAFFATVCVIFMAMTSLFRVFGTVCQSYDVAARLASIIITGLDLFAGHVIPRDAMRRWLFWISYINPLYYGFSSVMISGPGCPATVGDFQTCTLVGAQPRQQIISGLAYLSASFRYSPDQQKLDFAVVCIFLVGLVAMAAPLVEVF